MAKNVNLPEGFVLDEPTNNLSLKANLPEGFVLDESPEDKTNKKQILGTAMAGVTGLQPELKDVPGIASNFINGLAMNQPRTALEFPKQLAMGGPGLANMASGTNIPHDLSSLVNMATGGRTPIIPKVTETSGLETMMPEAETLGGKVAAFGADVAGGALSAKVSPKIGKRADNVRDYLVKSGDDFIGKDVTPRAFKMYRENVENFTPNIENYAKTKLKMPESAAKSLKKHGYQKIQSRRAEIGNADSIVQRINQGLDGKFQEAENAYKTAMSGVKGRAKQINLMNTKKKIGNVLRKYRIIDNKGNLTEYAQTNPVYNKLFAEYQDLNAIQTAQRPRGVNGSTQKQLTKYLKGRNEVMVDKALFSRIRDTINELYRDKPSDRDVRQVMNVFYSDGEKSGLEGLGKARALYRKAMENKNKYFNANGEAKAIIGESKLSRYHSIPEVERQKLKDLAKYIGDKSLIDDAEIQSIGQYVDKLDDVSEEKLFKALVESSDPKKTDFTFQRIKQMVGEENALELKKDIIANRRGSKIRKGAQFVGGAGIADAMARSALRKIGGN